MEIALNDHERILVFQGKSMDAAIMIGRRLPTVLPYDIIMAIKQIEDLAQHRQAKLLEFTEEELELIRKDKPWSAVKLVKTRLPVARIMMIKEAVFIKKNELFQ